MFKFCTMLSMAVKERRKEFAFFVNNIFIAF